MTTIAAPSEPYLTDEYQPTNANLWQNVLEVARGDRRELRIGDRTINSPNAGRGFYPWPHPNGIAWAVKQYNGFNGGWSRKESGVVARMRAGATIATEAGSYEHTTVELLKREGFVRLSSVSGPWHYWEPTYRGRRHFRASLGDDFRRKMEDVLQAFDEAKAKALGEWIEENFRVQSPKTPKGGKELKQDLERIVWVLKHRVSSQMGDPTEVREKARAEVESYWKGDIEPHLAKIVTLFTDEGGKVVPKELTLGGVTYVNEVGVDAASVEKYAKRLEVIFNSITGWRSKAMKPGLKVVLSSPRNFSGTVTGKYKRDQDALFIRATPNVLKRDAGYASFEYIIVHELAHRYERLVRTPLDFDKVEWWTTKYSHNEGEAFAELFALGHFNLTGSWDKNVVERFEKAMASS